MAKTPSIQNCNWELFTPTIRLQNLEEAEKVLRFLELEIEFDKHNSAEMLRVDVEGLTKGKIKDIASAIKRYPRESKQLIKKIKNTLKLKHDYEKFDIHAKERKWLHH